MKSLLKRSFFIDPETVFVMTTSQRTLFRPWGIFGPAFFIDFQAQRDQFFVPTKNFANLFVMIFLFSPVVSVCLLHLPPIDTMVQSYDLAIIGLILFILLSILSPIFWFHWKIKKLTKGLQKLSRFETLKVLIKAKYYKLSSLICVFSFSTLFLYLFSSISIFLSQGGLALIAQINYVIIKADTSSKSIISQFCSVIIESKNDCLDILGLIFLLGTSFIQSSVLALACIIISFSFGYMIIIKLQNKKEKGQV